MHKQVHILIVKIASYQCFIEWHKGQFYRKSMSSVPLQYQKTVQGLSLHKDSSCFSWGGASQVVTIPCLPVLCVMMHPYLVIGDNMTLKIIPICSILYQKTHTLYDSLLSHKYLPHWFLSGVGEHNPFSTDSQPIKNCLCQL